MTGIEVLALVIGLALMLLACRLATAALGRQIRSAEEMHKAEAMWADALQKDSIRDYQEGIWAPRK